MRCRMMPGQQLNLSKPQVPRSWSSVYGGSEMLLWEREQYGSTISQSKQDRQQTRHCSDSRCRLGDTANNHNLKKGNSYPLSFFSIYFLPSFISGAVTALYVLVLTAFSTAPNTQMNHVLCKIPNFLNLLQCWSLKKKVTLNLSTM